MLAKIRILLLDDDPAIRTLLRLVLNTTADLELLEATADVAQLPRLCAKITPHILLIGGGNEALICEILSILRQQTPPPYLVAFLPATGEQPLFQLSALPLRASYLKAEIDETLVHILRAVAGGATAFSHGAIERAERTSLERALARKGATLSDSERRVLALLVRGLDNPAIATQLHIAKSTVANYVHSIYAKLDLHSRVDLVLWFYGTTLPKAEK